MDFRSGEHHPAMAPSFPAAHGGKNSLRSQAENETSKLCTLCLGYQVTPTKEVFLDAERAGGHGISDALGLAGFTDLGVVRNPDLGAEPYLARLFVRRIISLPSELVAAECTPLGLAASFPARRIEIILGKCGLVDFLDLNS